MDTDGSTTGASTTYSTVSIQLKNDIIELVQSLGGIATYTKRKTFYTYKGKKIQGQDVYNISIKFEDNIIPFRLNRKITKYIPKTKYKPIRYITNIKFKHKFEAQCILVDDPSHLYVTDNYIVTHNTLSACYTALSLLADGKVDKIVITKPLVEANEKTMGFLPGTMEDKIKPHMKSYYHNFEKILGKFVFEQLLVSGVIVIEVLNFMRGDTFDNAILLLDEAQNCEMTDLILWITRMGKTSKAVMMGDVSQYDINKRDAKFLTFIDILADVEDVKNFAFTQDDIMRHELLKKIVDRYEKWKYAGDKDKKMIKS